MTAWFVPNLVLGTHLAQMSTSLGLGLGIGLFEVGWIIQFVGHVFEGKKPAFVDDLVGLLIGPLFLMAEATFTLGLRKDLRATIESNFNQPAPPAGALPHA